MHRWRQFFRGIFRFIGSGLWVYAELFVAATLLLGTPPVQNAFRPWLADQLRAALGVEVSFSYVNVGLPDHLVLHDVVLCDRANLEMIRVGRLGVGVVSPDVMAFLSGAKLRHARVRSVTLDHVMLNLYHRTRDGRLNLDVVFEGETLPPPDTSAPSGKVTLISVGDIAIRDMRFRFVDSVSTAADLRPTPGHVNYANLNLTNISLDGGFYWLGAGHYKVAVKKFTFDEVHAGVHVDQVSTTFEADQHWALHDTLPDEGRPEVSFIRFDDLRVRQGRTDVRFDVLFWNEEYRSLFRSNAPKRYQFTIRPSTVDFASVNFFTAEDLPVVGLARLQGTITGNPDRLRCRDLRADYGQHTHIEADVRLQDYLRGDSLFIQARLKGACSEGNELHALLPTSDLPNELRRLGRVCVTGGYTGFVRDFVADARFDTDLGTVITDLNFKRVQDQPVFYEGRLQTEGFDLDALFGTEASRRLSLDAHLYGRGLTLADADTRLDFSSSRSLFKSYVIDSMRGNLRIANRDIQGALQIIDPQGSFDGRIDINLSKGTPSYFFLGDLQRIDLNHYGLYPDTLLLSTIFNLNVAGDSLDNLSGTIRCFEVALRDLERKRDYTIKDLILSSKLNSAQHKSVQLSSRLGVVGLQGDFSYAEAVDLVGRLAHESELFFRNQPDSIAAYYMNKFSPTRHTQVSAQVLVKELNPLLDFLRSPLRIAEGAELQARFTFDEVDLATLRLSADSLAWGTQRLHDIKGSIDIEKPAMQNLIVGSGTVTADAWFLADGVRFDRINLQPFVRNRRVDLRLGLSQDSLRKRLDLLGSVGLIDGGFVATIDADSSRLVVNDNTWRFDRDNRFEYQPGRLLIDHLRLSASSQSIGIEADAGVGRPDVLYATVRNVELSGLADIFLPRSPVSGTVNGTLTLRNPLDRARVQVEGSVRRFQYDQLVYGDIYLRSRLSEVSDRMYLTSNLVYRGDTLIGVRGFYEPNHATSPLNFVLATHNLPVRLVEPFVKGILYDMSGQLQVEALQVRGTLGAPTITGSGRLEGVRFGADYFQTRYTLDGRLDFNQRVITMADVTLRDARGNPARVEGTIRHFGFTALDFDLRVRDIRNFLLMDTQSDDNELFYGRVLVRRGSADIKGKFGDLFINAAVTTGVGSRLSIPVSFYRKQARLPYVRFRGADGAEFTGVGQVDVLGMTLNLEIETTPDAEGRIVFDERANDIITVAGTGTLNFIITRLGDLSMYGTYEVERGNYPFTFRKLINKNFSVERGGTITWNGDPYDAQMNVSAINRVNASLSSLDTTIRSSQLVPVDVYLRLRGAIFRPEVSFDIQFPSTSQDASLALGALQRSITNDPQALNNQVISLLGFGRFAPQGNFFGAGGAAGGVASSASELLSNQLNTILGRALDNAVNVNFSTSNFNDVNLAIRTNLFNNRLTIERNGVLVSQTNRNFTLGNISVRYRLLPSERRLQTNPNPLTLSVEIFNRENFGFGNQLVSTSRGGGVFLRKEFDTFGELLPSSSPRVDTTTVIRIDSTLRLPRSLRPDTTRRDSLRADTLRRDTSALPGRRLRIPGLYFRQ